MQIGRRHAQQAGDGQASVAACRPRLRTDGQPCRRYRHAPALNLTQPQRCMDPPSPSKPSHTPYNLHVDFDVVVQRVNGALQRLLLERRYWCIAKAKQGRAWRC